MSRYLDNKGKLKSALSAFPGECLLTSGMPKWRIGPILFSGNKLLLAIQESAIGACLIIADMLAKMNETDRASLTKGSEKLEITDKIFFEDP